MADLHVRKATRAHAELRHVITPDAGWKFLAERVKLALFGYEASIVTVAVRSEMMRSTIQLAR